MVDKTSIRILSLDGGSLAHTAIPLFVLSEIEQRLGRTAASMFDVVAGIGYSAFCAAGLVIPDEGGELNSATDLTTFYLHNFQKFIKRRRFGKPALEAPLQNFFKQALLSEAKVELMLPMLDLQNGTLAQASSWKAREEQAQDFVVADLVARSMMPLAASSMKPVVSQNGTKNLFSSGGQTFANPTQILHSAVAALCGPNTQIQVVSISADPAEVSLKLADLSVLENEAFAQKLQSTSNAVVAEQVDKLMQSQMVESLYRRLDYSSSSLDRTTLKKIDLKLLDAARQQISAEVQTLDLEFLA